MALTATNYRINPSLFQSHATAFVLLNETITENASFDSSTSFTAQEISVMARQFIKSLYRIISPVNAEDLKPLSEIFNAMISEENVTIKQALNKQIGYLYRLFSTESWEEWLESKTPLGKVVDVFINCIRSPKAQGRLINSLDATTLKTASTQAENLLKQLHHSHQITHAEPSMFQGLGQWAWSMLPRFSSPSLTPPCAVGLTMGTLGSVVMNNPLLMAAGATSCATAVNAHEIIESEESTSAPTSVPMSFRAYISVQTSDTTLDGVVSVIDTYDNKLVANLSLNCLTSGIAITPNSRYAYVPSRCGAAVSVIDTSRNTVVNKVYFNGTITPDKIAITPNSQYAYVLSKVNYTRSNMIISIIETSSNLITTTIAGLVGCSDIAITPNGLFAYVPCSYYNSSYYNLVNVINTSSNEIINTVALAQWTPSAIAITPDGLYAYVVASFSKNINVSVIETSSNTITDTVYTSYQDIPLFTAIAITPNGLYAYLTTTGMSQDFTLYGIVTVIATTNNTVVNTISLSNSNYSGLTYPYYIAITPDGLFAYVTSGSNSYSVIDTTSNEVIATVGLGGVPLGIAITSARMPPVPPPPSPPAPNIDWIIGLSCAGGGVVILGLIGATACCLKNEDEAQIESSRLLVNSDSKV